MSSLEGGQGTDHWLTEEGRLQQEQLGKNWEAGAWTSVGGTEDWFGWLETERVAKAGERRVEGSLASYRETLAFTKLLRGRL